MRVDELNEYLQQRIPLSRHMGMRVLELDAERIRVGLPLEANRNPHGTVFGGSLAALGLASAWMLLHARFTAAGLPVTLVGKRGECDFLAPAQTDCVAETRCDAEAQAALFEAFRQKARARQALTTVIRAGDVEVARHQGLYTALRPTS